MNKKGSVLIECLIAIVIFLIGIVPITAFTINSLSIDRRSNEIEEAARITTTVIDYIKSEGYEGILDNLDGVTSGVLIYDTEYDESTDSASVDLDKPISESSSESTWKTTSGKDISKQEFDLEGRGIDLEDAELKISFMQTNLVLDTTSSYTNPVTNSTASDVIFGTEGLLEDQLIYGNVTIRYKSKKSASENYREYGQNFILVPMENFN
jgi:hypothetical protein